ncbi:MAG: hypothetical protein WCJ19_04950 [bacterium]
MRNYNIPLFGAEACLTGGLLYHTGESIGKAEFLEGNTFMLMSLAIAALTGAEIVRRKLSANKLQIKPESQVLEPIQSEASTTVVTEQRSGNTVISSQKKWSRELSLEEMTPIQQRAASNPTSKRKRYGR